METNTKIGIAGGSLLTIFSSITQNEVEKTVVLGAIGTVVSIIVSWGVKTLVGFMKKKRA